MRHKGMRCALIFFAAIALILPLWASAASIAIIGGADGPTDVYITTPTEAPEDDWTEGEMDEGSEGAESTGDEDWGDESADEGGDWGDDESADEDGDWGDDESADGGWDETDDASAPSDDAASANASAQTVDAKALEKARFDALHTPVENPNLSIDATLGYDGVVFYQSELPFRVTLTNHGGDLDGYIAFNVYANTTYYDRIEYPIYLAAGAQKEAVIPVTLTTRQSTYTIEYCVGDSVIASKNFEPKEIIAPTVALVGTLSSDPSALNYMTISATNDALMRGAYFRTLPLTADTFPDTASQLSAFGVLAVDDFDVRTLTAARQEALRGWLTGGGIVIVGGGAAASVSYPYFEQFTGIKSGALSAARDITPALMEGLGISMDALGQPVMTNEIVGADILSAIDDDENRPLVATSKIGDGVVLTAAFELGARPLTTWGQITPLWQRILIKSANPHYQALFDGDYDSWSYSNSDYYIASVLDRMSVENTFDSMPILLLLGAYLLLSGIISYLILKRMDRRELMWVVMPLCAVVGALAIWAISLSTDLNQPMATSLTQMELTEDGAPRAATYVSVGSADSGAMTVSAGKGLSLTPMNDDDVYYGDPYSATASSPTLLKNRFIYEDPMRLGYASSKAWQAHYFKVDAPPSIAGDIDGRLWMEDDGMHIEIANNTGTSLNHCAVITSLGFVSLPDLAPGQQVTARLTYLTPEQEKLVNDERTANGYALVFDGCMIVQDQRSLDRYGDFYQFIETLCFPDENVPGLAAREKAQQSAVQSGRVDANLRQTVLQSRLDSWNGAGNMICRFIGFTDDLMRPEPTLNGQAIARTKHMALIDKALTYEPVGATGIAYYPLGFMSPSVATVTDGVPAMADASTTDLSYRLATHPAFGFKFPEGFAASDLSIISNYYDNPATLKLYNHQTTTWDAQKSVYLRLQGDAIAPYIGADGTLFILYEPNEQSGRYSEVMAPSIMLKGSVKQ